MKESTIISGLILRETEVKDYNKIISVLTPTQGIVNVYCYGALSMKSKNFPATQPFSYSELEISEGKNGYVLKSSAIIRYFGSYTPNLIKYAMLNYCAEVLLYVCCENTDEEEMLRLAMNTLHAIDKDLKDVRLIKAVFELKCAQYQGIGPELDGCMECGQPIVAIDCREGGGLCQKHFDEIKNSPDNNSISVSEECLSAMKYVLECPSKKMLSFNLSENCLNEFAAVCEKYLEYQLERRFYSLDFYHTSLDMSE